MPSSESSGPTATSSSGRSTPDMGHQQQSLPQTGSFASFPRRSSTPAHSFLPPTFWPSHHNLSASKDHGEAGPPAFFSIPRRTSFGAALGGGSRFSALSTLGMGPSTPIHTNPTDPHKPPLTKAHTTHGESAVASADSTPIPSAPSSPAAKQRRKRSICYLPGPDGLCVESRGGRRSEDRS